MVQASEIKEHMEVRSSDGLHIGTVDHMDGADQVKLTRTDPAAHGQHNFVPLAWVDHVNEHVHLSASAADVRGLWEQEPA